MGADRVARVGARVSRIRQLRALTDSALVDAMRGGEAAAFHAFVDRFGPLLEEYARALHIPTADWSTCIDDVLIDAALRFTAGTGELPRQLGAYLRRMTRSAYLKRRRDREFEARLASLAESEGTEPVLRALCAEDSVRASSAYNEDHETAARALGRLGRMLMETLDSEEQLVITWVANRVPHRKIAEWTRSSYSATAKRTWRLERRLRDTAFERMSEFDEGSRREIDRFLRRATGRSVLLQLPDESRDARHSRSARRNVRARDAPDTGDASPAAAESNEDCGG
jgi:hypothetical protein